MVSVSLSVFGRKFDIIARWARGKTSLAQGKEDGQVRGGGGRDLWVKQFRKNPVTQDIVSMSMICSSIEYLESMRTRELPNFCLTALGSGQHSVQGVKSSREKYLFYETITTYRAQA